MASSNTTLPFVQQNQSGKEITANNLFAAASPIMLFARDQSRTAGLNWAYLGGTLLNGTALVDIADGTLTLPASTTSYIEATTAGVVSANTTGFTSGQIRLYKVVTGTTTITSWEDKRAVALAVAP